MDRRCIVARLPDGRLDVHHDPTIGDIRLARQNGKIILRQRTKLQGGTIHKTWITDAGVNVVLSIDPI